MIPTNISNLSEDAGRTFELEVTGSPHQARLRTSNYKVKVPYSALSTTISSIGQRGGKIVSVKRLSSHVTEVASSTQVQPIGATEVTSSPEQHKAQVPVAVESSPPVVEKVVEEVESSPPVVEKVVEEKVVKTNSKSNSKAFVPTQTKSSKSKKR
jgi:phycocyanin-associated, rod